MTGPSIDVGIRASVDSSVSKSANQAQATFTNLGDTLKGVAKTSSLIAKGTSKGLKKASLAAKQAEREFEKLRKSMEQIYFAGLHLSLIGGVITGLGVFPIAAASKFEAEMSKVLAVTSGAKDSFESLNAVASELGRTTQFTATQAAEGLTFLGMAGFEANQAISALPATLNLALVGGVELGRAADIVTNTVQAMRLSVSDLDHVTNVLSNTITSSNVDMEQLADTLKYVATPAEAAGIDIDSLAATIGALGNAGIQGTLSGTNLRAMIISLAAPTKKAKDALDKLGVTISYTEDGSLDLFTTMGDLRDANFSLADATAIFQRRAATSALAIAGQVDAVRELAAANKSAAGATEEMAKIMQDNVKGVILKITSAFDGLMRSIAKGAMGPVKTMGLAFAKMVSAMASAIEAMGAISGVVLGLVVAFGSLVTVLGLAALGYGTYGRAMTTLIKMFRLTEEAVTASAIAQTSVLIAQTKTAASMSMLEIVGARLRIVFISLKTAILDVGVALKAVFMANRALAVIAAIGAAIAGVVMHTNRMIKKYEKLSSAAFKYNSTLMDQRKEYLKLLDTYRKAEEGSKEQDKAVIALKDNINQLTSAQGDLGTYAEWAADALNKESGALFSIDESLRMMKDTFYAKLFNSLGEAIELSGKKIDVLQRKYKVLEVFIFGPSQKLHDLGEEMDKTTAKMVSETERVIKSLSAVGAIDMTAGLDEFIKLLPKAAQIRIKSNPKLFRGISEAYRKVQKEILSINNTITKQDKKSADEQIAIIKDRYGVESRALSNSIKEYIKYKEVQKSVDGSDSDRARKSKLASLEKATLLYKQTAVTLQEYNRQEIDGLDRVARAQIDSVTKATRLGIQSKEEEELRTLAIEYDMAKKTADIRQKAVDAMRGKQFAGIGGDTAKAFDAVVKAASDSKIKMEEIGQRTGEAYSKMLGVSLDKAKGQFEEYLKIVDEANARIVEIEQASADAVRAIRQKLMTDEEKRRDDLALADTQAAELQKEYLNIVKQTIPKIKELMAAGKSDEASKEAEKLRNRIGEIKDKAKGTISLLKGLSVKDTGEEEALIRRIKKIESTVKDAAGALKNVSLVGSRKSVDQIDEIGRKIAQLTADPKEIDISVVLKNIDEVENRIQRLGASSDTEVGLRINIDLDKDIVALKEELNKEIGDTEIDIQASQGTINVIKDVTTGITTISNSLGDPKVLSIDGEQAKRVITDVISRIEDEFPNGQKVVRLVVKTQNESSGSGNDIAFSTGGKVPGGFGGGDRIRAWLEPGEQVIDKYTSRALGDNFFDKMRNMSNAMSTIPSTIFEYMGKVGRSAKIITARGMQSGGKVTAGSSSLPHLGQIDFRFKSGTATALMTRSMAEELKAILRKESMVRSN